MEKYTYQHPMNISGKLITPMMEMIDYLNAQVEMQTLAGQQQTVEALRMAIGVALQIYQRKELPMLKGAYQEGRFDQYHAGDEVITDEQISKASEVFLDESFEM